MLQQQLRESSRVPVLLDYLSKETAIEQEDKKCFTFSVLSAFILQIVQWCVCICIFFLEEKVPPSHFLPHEELKEPVPQIR